MVIASLLHTILASTLSSERPHFVVGGGTLHFTVWTHQFAYPFPKEHLGCFPVVVMMDQAAVNIPCADFGVNRVLNSFMSTLSAGS